MILFLLAYLGGALTIASPCILPVLPFVFARAGRPFVTSILPMLVGMAATFSAVATLAAIGGGWAVQANEYGRMAAIALLAVFGVALLFPTLSDRLTRPLVAMGARLSQSADRQAEAGGSTVLPSLLIGVATGLLWAPCAGPVLGLILTGAALQGASVHTTLLLASYAAGAATSLALALLIGGKVFAAMKRALGVGEWVRRGLGAAMLVGVAVIALGLDTGLLTQVSLARTTTLEQGLLDRFQPPTPPSHQFGVADAVVPAAPDPTAVITAARAPAEAGGAPPMAETLPVEGQLPSLEGAVEWLNSPPLTAEGLRGHVVLVDFWTYSCINCLRALPYVRAWAEKYRSQGLVVIGVHAPEFAFERSVDNVRKAVANLHVDYPVAVDSNYALWRAFSNRFWPAHYFIDAQGRIRHHHFGEGEYEESEHVIQQLLAEAGRANVPAGVVEVAAAGVQAAPDLEDVGSQETYIGSARAANFVSAGGLVAGKPHLYASGTPRLNGWGLTGNWTVGEERASLNDKGGGIVYRFHARDLHLVLGPSVNGTPVRFQVTVDGAPPGRSHGSDVDADGHGVVTGQQLYQLVRQDGTVADHTFAIRFLDPGVQAYAFTFG